MEAHSLGHRASLARIGAILDVGTIEWSSGMNADDVEASAGRADVFGKYALAGRRYKRLLGGNFMRMPHLERDEFGRGLARDSKGISRDELRELFEGDWRERLAGAWLAGFGLRIEMRETIYRLLLQRDERHAGKGYCFALARFGSAGDAQVISEYLRQYLEQLDLRADQPWAVGALMVLDENLGTAYSAEFLQDGGAWDSWVKAGESATFTASQMMGEVQSWCSFASDFVADL
jgi:hypothetical protein